MASYTYCRKKYRGYRREFKRMLRLIEKYTPDWRPAEGDSREEWLDLYGNSRFCPRGRDKKQLLAALLDKTWRIMEDRSPELPFCKVFLMVCEGQFYNSEIILIYDQTRFRTFWNRSNLSDQRWTKLEGESLLERLDLFSPLKEQGYLEEIDGDWRQKLWFYGEVL